MEKNHEVLTLLGKLLTPVARAECLLSDVQKEQVSSPETQEHLNTLEREWNRCVLGVSKTFKEVGTDLVLPRLR